MGRCDFMMMSTREAAEAMFTIHHGLMHCDTLKVGGQQCCGGQVNQKNWRAPTYCNLPYTMANETECMVDRWLRHNDVVIKNTLVVPGNLHLLRWRFGKGKSDFTKHFNEMGCGRCKTGTKGPEVNMRVLQTFGRFSDWRFRDCAPNGFEGGWNQGYTPENWVGRRLGDDSMVEYYDGETLI
jgi:hypothetical protein